MKKLLATAALGCMLIGNSAHAYYDKTDYTEAYTILPNETGFYIPDVGGNKDSQVKYDSAEYYNANRIALKRFTVPHVKLSGSGSFYDFYVPAGRLIIVDRTTYSHEWVDAHDRGSSTKKEGFPCQSKEGLNITAGVSAGVDVREDNAHIYLYNFGTVAPVVQNRSDPQVIFTSVYYSRKVSDVMDTVGRRKIQTLVCDEIGKRSFDEANKDMIPMMVEIEKKAKEYFASVGITLSFIGWGSTFEFDPQVQEAINHRYASTQQAAALALLKPYADIIAVIAQSEATQNFGRKTDGKLPTTMTTVGEGGNPAIGMMLGGMFRQGTEKPLPLLPPQAK